MAVNIKKTKYVSYTRKTNYFVSAYRISNNKIDKTNKIKDLGVNFDGKLNFNEHIVTIAKEARKLLGYIFNQWTEMTRISTFILLYKVLIRPRLEHAIVIWHPSAISKSQQLESIQKCFIRMLCFKFNLNYFNYTYEHWCDYFTVDPLYNRMRIADKNFIDNVISNKIDCKYILEQLNFKVPKYNFRDHIFLGTRDKNTTLSRLVNNFNLLEK
jgi:hypothetical protein